MSDQQYPNANLNQVIPCLLLEPKCPSDYQHIGKVTDGRTCHGILSEYPKPFEYSTCEVVWDILRDKWLPRSPKEMELFLNIELSDEASCISQDTW